MPLINSLFIENIFSSLKILPRVYKIECYLYILELGYNFIPFHSGISSFYNCVLLIKVHDIMIKCTMEDGFLSISEEREKSSSAFPDHLKVPREYHSFKFLLCLLGPA